MYDIIFIETSILQFNNKTGYQRRMSMKKEIFSINDTEKVNEFLEEKRKEENKKVTQLHKEVEEGLQTLKEIFSSGTTKKINMNLDSSTTITKDIGTVHDEYLMSFEGELEEYFIKKYEKKVEVELLQSKDKTDGLLEVQVMFSPNDSIVIGYEETKKIVEEIYETKIDEMYVNFASKIVYFITLHR